MSPKMTAKKVRSLSTYLNRMKNPATVEIKIDIAPIPTPMNVKGNWIPSVVVCQTIISSGNNK